jgi:hypothetical protein
MEFICKECLKNMRGGECTLDVSEICGEPVTPTQCPYGADCDWVKE